MLTNKTGKREIALVLTTILCWSIIGGDVAMVEAIVWPILSYVAAASGLHIYHQSTRVENAK
jgi:TM2 domain-containing membrane protein YozV